jgi:P-type conjugative transfer ATPase TrbB
LSPPIVSNLVGVADQRRQRIEDKVRRELGPTVLAALEDPNVIEIMLNPDGRIWVDEFGKGMRDTGETMCPAQAESMLATVAMTLNTVINANRPLLEAELLIDGSRISGALPPVVAGPIFAIRKRPSRVFTIEDYVTDGIVSLDYALAIREAIASHQNILIVGSAGSGKTTFANALLREIADSAGSPERIAILEDTIELQCTAKNRIELRTTDDIDMPRLLRATLRLRPDRIVVGEVRGTEALLLIKAWNTGHPGGIATIHANGCIGGLTRLEQLIQESGVAAQPWLIADTVNLLVHIERTISGRIVSDIQRVRSWSPANGYESVRVGSASLCPSHLRRRLINATTSASRGPLA